MSCSALANQSGGVTLEWYVAMAEQELKYALYQQTKTLLKKPATVSQKLVCYLI